MFPSALSPPSSIWSRFHSRRPQIKNPMMKNAPAEVTINPFGLYQPPSVTSGKTT